MVNSEGGSGRYGGVRLVNGGQHFMGGVGGKRV